VGNENGADKTTKTKYAVLRRLEDEPDDPPATTWDFIGIVEATNADRAKGHFAEETGIEGEYVAVPARSWIPSPVTLERTPRAVVSRSIECHSSIHVH
jgi:hypothetical protein